MSQCRLIAYLHQRPIFFKTNSIHSSIVAILELIRGAQCWIEVIRSSDEEMWRVDAYQIPYYSRGIEEAKRTRPRFADCIGIFKLYCTKFYSTLTMWANKGKKIDKKKYEPNVILLPRWLFWHYTILTKI